MTDDQILDAILEREGGYTDLPEDPGGPTNMGITQATLSLWRRRAVSAADVQNLTRLEALAIYRRRYLTDTGLAGISSPALRAFALDCAVQHGPLQAVRILQRVLGGLVLDGVLGPKTRAALEAAEPRRLLVRACGERMRYYGSLITHRPALAVFAGGWADRVADFLDDVSF